MRRVPQSRMDSKAGDTLSYSATTFTYDSLSGDRSHQAYARVQENPASLTPAASSTITHAVSSKSGGNTYTYDSLSSHKLHQAYARVRENPASNGNAISRGNQTLIYDEENRLVEVQENSMTIAEYVYDGDGNRVESVVTDGSQTITTVYIGSYYEQITTVVGGSSTTEWNKYYYAGAVRLAMRENSEEPYYLITDHLGSTSLVVDSLGQEVARQSYLPFGEEWGSSAIDLPTSFTYTGQREAAEIGLHYYIARWYDAGSLSGFTQRVLFEQPHQAYARVRENPACDGNQVKSVVTDGSQTITTVYIGSYYEQIRTSVAVTATDWKKYYYAGSVRLAIRENSDDPLYLVSDHLGSTSLVVDSLGQEVARQSYLPFGEEWGSIATGTADHFHLHRPARSSRDRAALLHRQVV